MSDRYDKYIDQQRRQYAKSVPISDWRKQLKNGKSNQKLLDMIPEGIKGGRALDIGAGEGYHTEDLMNMGFKASGIELLEKRVNDAHKLGRDYVVQGDAHKLPWDAKTFDLVFMHEVLEHCAYPLIALSEIRRVLVPNGVFLISLPLEGHWKGIQCGIGDHNLDVQDTHVWKPNVVMLHDYLTKVFGNSFKIHLYELNSIKFKQIYKPGDAVRGFRPHAFVEGFR